MNVRALTSRLYGMTIPERLFLQDRCLAVFVDDTGHEALVKGHPVYGLGGCAVMGRDLEHVIRQPWKEIRKRVTGSPGTPLHANKFPSIAKPGDIEAVGEFSALSRFRASVPSSRARQNWPTS